MPPGAVTPTLRTPPRCASVGALGGLPTFATDRPHADKDTDSVTASRAVRLNCISGLRRLRLRVDGEVEGALDRVRRGSSARQRQPGDRAPIAQRQSAELQAEVESLREVDRLHL